jgi:hypothetical protein
MTGIRKLLLALAVIAVLFALLKGFSFFDMQRYLGTARSDLDRNRTELKKLEAEEPDAKSSKGDRLEMLRRSVPERERSIEEAESRAVGSVVSAVVSLMVAGGLFFLFSAAGKTDSPLGQQLARLPAAAIALGLGALLLLVISVTLLQGAISQKKALDETMKRVAEAKTTLESIDYDKNGNVPSAQRMDYIMAMSTLKTSGPAIADRRSEFTMLTAATAGTGVGAVLCLLFAVRSMKRRVTT